MIVNILIGLAIFGYAGWMMVRHIKKSKQGKCAACPLNKSCSCSCSEQESTSITGLK
ncbi:FeoB-associated Cys-rich membrane protein [Virgibacillus proomii]|uniref:FeoB-associated Cys-rich membrane protein n=1 Tax=Virgibacillus proomii TaxID=84407 RepID=UPI001C12728D|nr:FeoB-associated Cys-rich membrane protein [Virgibacillus proomii]MBU5268246.1 FeoB-associated Cys-rich membrane protein [Virgibacillus proomii]